MTLSADPVLRVDHLARLFVWTASAAFLVYLVGLAPTFAYGDFADLPLRVLDPSEPMFVHSLRNYPLYRLVGGAFARLPLGDLAWRINLMTAVFGAMAVGMVAVIGYLLAGRRSDGIAMAVMLGLSHTFWLLSEMAEVYTLAVLLGLWLALSLLLWTRTGRSVHLWSAGLALGLGLSHHSASALLVPGVLGCVLVAWRRLRPAAALGAAALALVGAIPFLHLLALMHDPAAAPATPGPPASLPGARDILLAGAFLAYQFPGTGLVLGVIGGWRLLRERSAWGTFVLLAFLCTWAWSIASRIPDKYNAYVFSYPFFVLMAGTGLPSARNWVHARGRRPATVALLASLAILPLASYVIVPVASRALRVDLVRARPCPYRDNAWFFLFPPKTGFTGARRYAQEALDEAAPDAIIVADYSLWRPLRYLQVVEGRRRDIELVFVEPLLRDRRLVPFVRERSSTRPVYLAWDQPPGYYGLEELARTFRLSHGHWLVRLQEPEGGGVRPPAGASGG